MEDLIKTTFLGLFFGTFGTTIGGILGTFFYKDSNKLLSGILSFASGIMTAIVCFDLIPEAMKISGIVINLCGIIAGILTMFFCYIIIEKKYGDKIHKNSKGNLLKTGIIISIGLAIHNFPEGLAIGSGFEASSTLGYSLAIAIALHDIPEGFSMAVPLKSGGIGKNKIIIYIMLSGLTTGIGVFLGKIIGNISENIIALCLTFSAGAMLYIISGELIPESNSLYKGRLPAVANIIGFLLGMLSLKA